MNDSMYVVVAVLIGLAGVDLWVGVTNDAVNFMNSAFGAEAAKRRTILMLAIIGVALGALLSGGMMEVARKGIFNPDFFRTPGGFDVSAVLMIYLGVMAADVMMLDTFNTFGFPTSTTVSIVSELAGASLAVAFWTHGRSIRTAAKVLDTGPMARIYTGIFLSVVIAFVTGAVVMFLVRIAFGHDLKRSFAKLGWLWAGLSTSAIVYFLLFKGLKHASFLTASIRSDIHHALWLILGGTFTASALLVHFYRHKHELVLRVLILMSTMALAMAFAGNDLVNFIGPAVAGATAAFSSKHALSGHVTTPVWALGLAGVAMGLALFRSKKTATVSDAELRIASQGDVPQRFSVPAPIATLVILAARANAWLVGQLPRRAVRWISDRMVRTASRGNNETTTPPYDLLRASVNLSLATVLISIGTAQKLPLSTTYITFMVAMGAALGDGTWRSGQAASRFTGMLAVISGWLLTGLIAATGAFITATVAYLLGPTLGTLALTAAVILSMTRLSLMHRKRARYSRPSLRGVTLTNPNAPTEVVANLQA